MRTAMMAFSNCNDNTCKPRAQSQSLEASRCYIQGIRNYSQRLTKYNKQKRYDGYHFLWFSFLQCTVKNAACGKVCVIF